jgi:hypothetical protein
MTPWKSMDTAPQDGTHLLLLTSDFGPVEGWWDANRINFYKSQKGWASHDPKHALGEWCSYLTANDPNDPRMFCGMTPHFWMELPPTPQEGAARDEKRRFDTLEWEGAQ